MKEFKLYLNGLTCANCGNKIERKVDSLKEVEEVKDLLKTGMESACKLNVPLLAEVSEATNWYDCK